MTRLSLRSVTSVALTAVLAVGAVIVSPVAANAAGVGDQTDAVLYGPTGPIGDVLTDLSDEDDNSTTVAAPFAINFFGVKSAGLCITTNGVIAPVATELDSCASDYDSDLADYAIDNEESAIGALLADLDLSEELFVAPGPIVPLAAFSSASQILTFTTTSPHTFEVGEWVEVTFDPEHPELGDRQGGYVDSIPAPNQFTWDWTGDDFPDQAEAPFTGSVEGEGEVYEDTAVDADSLGDDGFGNVKQVYAGSTTVDGKPAFAVTWFRVPTNDDTNSQLLSNTFQLVIIQEPTTDGDTLGYDFSVQFNFGTLTDGNDGYKIGSPSDECDSNHPETCAWSVGWVRYDAIAETAQEFEFFADVPVTDLIDGAGNTALINNSLNSPVYGRYMMSMFGGVTTGYSVPVLDGREVEAAQLPNTGTDVTPLIAASALLLLLGAALFIGSRRRRSEQA
jgi:LPXTG-motif cell wall-anchored protein